MIKFFEKEYRRFIVKQFRKLYSKNSEEQMFKDFMYYANTKESWRAFDLFIMHFLNEWREFYYKNRDKIDDYFNILNKNMDSISVESAKLLFERNLFLLPAKIETDKKWLMVYQNNFYSDFEKNEQKNYFNGFNDNYKLSNNEPITNYHMECIQGFKFIKEITVNYLKGKDFIDGGAYVGDTAVALSQLSPKRIFSFEPNKENYEYLKKTAQINNLENIIIPVLNGLGGEEKTIYFEGEKCGFYAVKEKTEYSSDISVTYIDKFVNDNDIDLGLLKLDVEGLEYETLEGAKSTIQKYNPILLISIYHNPKDFFEIKPLLEKFTPDYKFMIRPTCPIMLNTEFMLIAYPKKLEQNVLH